MRVWHIGGLLCGMAALATSANAAARLELRGLAAHVVIIPEARSDIAVRVIRSSRQWPVRLGRSGEVTVVAGNVGHRVHGCPMLGGGLGVRVRGLGNIEGADLPELVIRTPLAVRITAGDGVSGVIGRAASVDLENRGCGNWTLANVERRMRLSQVGSGLIQAGRAGTADLSVAGGGSIATRAVGGALTAVQSGEGEIAVDSIGGDMIARILGAGGIEVRGGAAPHLNVSVAGSGSVRFGGRAGAVTASVAGPGYIAIAHAIGPVSRRVFGAGEIQIGH